MSAIRDFGRIIGKFASDSIDYLAETGREAAYIVWRFAFKDATDYIEQKVPDLAKDTAEALASLTLIDEGDINAIIATIANNPEQTLAKAVNVALAAGPFSVIPIAALLGMAANQAVAFAFLDEMAVKQWNASKPLVPDQQITQWLASKPLVPDQQNTQWAAQRPLVSDQLLASLEARIAISPNAISTAEIVTARFRGVVSEAEYYEQMAFQGVARERAAIIYEASKWYPTPAILIEWLSKEVYEPDSIDRYGLLAEIDRVRRDTFYRAGMTDEQIESQWIAHWQHPPFTQITEMFRRDILNDPVNGRSHAPGSAQWQAERAAAYEQFQDWFRLVEIPPHWRERLIRMTYEPLTRVDIRRMVDFGLATDDDVVRNGLDRGYTLEDARLYNLFAKVSTHAPDVMAHWSKGWLTDTERDEQLLALGMAPEQVDSMVKQKVWNLARDMRVATERDLAVKDVIVLTGKGFMSWNDATAYLVRLGYDENEADLKLQTELDKVSLTRFGADVATAEEVQ